MYKLDLIEFPTALMERLDRDAEAPLLELRGRPTGSIFTKFDALISLGKYQDAVGFVIDREAAAPYRSWSDMFFCELFPEYAEACLAYYDDEDGVQLKETWNAEESRRCEQAMLCLLGLSLIIREDNPGDDVVCPVRWSTIVRMARDIAAQAPRPTSLMPQ